MRDSASSKKPHYGLNRRQFLAVSAGSATAVAGCLDRFGDDGAIEDWHDLDAVRENPHDDYRLVNDLDETTAGYDEHVGDPEGGWLPIGHSEADDNFDYRGTFDGQDNEIADLVIDRPETVAGLFASANTVESLTITDADIAGAYAGAVTALGYRGGQIAEVSVRNSDITGEETVGGLVGILDPHTEISEASVHESKVTGERIAGGLVGRNRSKVLGSSVHTTNVTGENEVGGLVGKNDAFTQVAESAVRGGVVTGTTSVGGLIGATEGHVMDSSVDEIDVTGDNMVGGLVGRVFPTNRSVRLTGASVSGSDVTGDTAVGGLAGSSFVFDADTAEVTESAVRGTDVSGKKKRWGVHRRAFYEFEYRYRDSRIRRGRGRH